MRQLFKRPKLADPKTELLGAAKESSKLSHLLDLIASQQHELKNVVENVGQSRQELNLLEIRLKAAKNETAEAEQFNEIIKPKYQNDLQTLKEEIALRQQTLAELSTRLDNETLRINKQLTELENKIKAKEIKHFEQLSSFQRVLTALI